MLNMLRFSQRLMGVPEAPARHQGLWANPDHRDSGFPRASTSGRIKYMFKHLYGTRMCAPGASRSLFTPQGHPHPAGDFNRWHLHRRLLQGGRAGYPGIQVVPKGVWIPGYPLWPRTVKRPLGGGVFTSSFRAKYPIRYPVDTQWKVALSLAFSDFMAFKVSTVG